MTTISRGLVTIKHFNTQFTNAIAESRFSGVVRNGVETTSGKKANIFIEEARTNIQSMKDKIQSDFDLRVKINQANNTTKVLVGKKEMTIAEALIYRQHTLPYVVALRNKLRAELKQAHTTYQRLEADHQEKLKLASTDEMKALLASSDAPSILDIQAVIDDLNKDIEFFELEFDAVLTETNPQVVLA